MMLDGSTAKFIDFGFSCLLAESGPAQMPGKLGKFKGDCGARKIHTPGQIKEGSHYRALGCPATGENCGTPAYDAPLKGFANRALVGGSAAPMFRAMAGSDDAAKQLSQMIRDALDDRYAVKAYGRSSYRQKADHPYVLSWEQGHSYDMFPFGLTAVELLTGQSGGLFAILRYACDGTIPGNKICGGSFDAFCSGSLGFGSNTRLSLWLALENLQAPPTTDEQISRARNRMWTLLKTVAEAARCGAPANAPLLQLSAPCLAEKKQREADAQAKADLKAGKAPSAQPKPPPPQQQKQAAGDDNKANDEQAAQKSAVAVANAQELRALISGKVDAVANGGKSAPLASRGRAPNLLQEGEKEPEEVAPAAGAKEEASSSGRHLRAVFSGPPLKALVPDLTYKVAPTVFMPTTFKTDDPAFKVRQAMALTEFADYLSPYRNTHHSV